MARHNSGPTFIGLFSGCGGLDLGFEQAGFRSIAAFDADATATATYSDNLRGNADICDLSSLNSLKYSVRPDVVIAGPPCQGFSTLGRRSATDPRNSLLIKAAVLAISCRPRAVLLENVAGVLSGTHRNYWLAARELLEAAGFATTEFRVVGTSFGLPQIRKRVILLASCRQIDDLQPRHECTQVGLESFLSGIDGLPNHSPRILRPGTSDYRIARRIEPHQKLCNVRGGDRSVPTWEIPEVFGEVTSRERAMLLLMQRLRRRKRLRSFGDADPVSLRDLNASFNGSAGSIVVRLQAKGYVRRLGRRFDLAHTFNGKYRRLSWKHPAPTVDTRFGQPRYFLHPEEHRGLSAREAARIQGFPDDFVFRGEPSTQMRMIGNAVPPPVAKWFADLILERVL